MANLPTSGHLPHSGGPMRAGPDHFVPGQAGFRDFVVLVVHPHDRDAELVMQQLSRLGCKTYYMWPAPDRLPQPVDMVICTIDDQSRALASSLVDQPQIALVGIVDPSKAPTVQLLEDMNPLNVLNKPLDAYEIVAGLVIARNTCRYQRRLISKIAKLEETLRSVRKVERAKAILMQKRRIDESTAYTLLREQAMQKRVPIGVIANAVVESHEVLQGEAD